MTIVHASKTTTTGSPTTILVSVKAELCVALTSKGATVTILHSSTLRGTIPRISTLQGLDRTDCQPLLDRYKSPEAILTIRADASMMASNRLRLSV